MADTVTLTSKCAVGCAATQLQARRLSSCTATCSYRPACWTRKRSRDGIACRAAEVETIDEEDQPDDLSTDILELLAPRTIPTPILSPQEVLENLYSGVHANAAQHYLSFFSTELGGIVTDPVLMVVHMDDHLVHRGHAVFDTAIIVDGFLYQLEEHLARFQLSAELAGLALPMTIEQIRRVILETAAASREVNAHVKYWLGAGRGGFGLSSSECWNPTFYCQVYTTPLGDVESERSMTVKTSEVPIKPPYFSAVKSTNYLPNVLTVMDAQAAGFDQGITVDDKGMVAEGPNMNLGIITRDNEVVVPPFDNSLAGITITTLLDLVPEVMGTDDLHGVDSIVRRHFSVEEGKAAREVFLAGSSLPVMPVTMWDGDPIGDGVPGRGVLSLKALLLRHMNPANNKGQHTEVPYGYLTGMD